MKKQLFLLFAILMSLALLLLLVSCGSKPNPVPDDDTPLVRESNKENTPVSGSENIAVNMPDFASIIAGNGSTDTVWGLQDAATRQEIIDSARADGIDISFGDDGSMTVKDEDGTVFVQNPNGTWTMQGEDGHSAQLGGDWPENEFTKLVPKPDFKIMGASASDDEFTAAFQSATVEEVKAYANKVKAKGFTVDAEEEDQNAFGIVVYTYSASNKDGYRIEITFAAGTSGITISK